MYVLFLLVYIGTTLICNSSQRCSKNEYQCSGPMQCGGNEYVVECDRWCSVVTFNISNIEQFTMIANGNVAFINASGVTTNLTALKIGVLIRFGFVFGE